MKKKKPESECNHYWIYKWADIDDEATRSRRCKTCKAVEELPPTSGELSLWNGMGSRKPVYGYKGGRPKGRRK
tara:strand:+ start:1228 stop:1446 length:219 start_codon:yes stop_codon:yes gene_type:complete